MVFRAASKTNELMIACLAYACAAFGTFLFSSLSHAVPSQPARDTFRAWDQAMIYTMIAGTYTPIAIEYAPAHILKPWIWAIWLAAAAGFFSKVVLRLRINAAGAISYLLLGWLPAIPLVALVPAPLGWSMLAGGVLYTIGVTFILNDHHFRYAHTIWHLFVILAAAWHFVAIQLYVVA